MDSSIRIRAENLGKRYTIGHLREPYKTLRESLVNAALAPVRRIRNFGRASHRATDTIWALRDATFEVREGEVLGVIGANGAGKSTLLKILTRITEPTAGRAEILGRVGSLLEVGTGFHPELTGRENVYLSGALLGMSRREIQRHFDEIVAFSGVERFIDTPIKRYSSGMKVRLGFAVAAHLQPEVLLIDEVLAVGDAEFQKRCLGKMSGIAESGRTILFVSHNMAAVSQLCSRVLWLQKGQTEAVGPADDIVRRYLLSTRSPESDALALADRADRRGNGVIHLCKAAILDAKDRSAAGVMVGDPLRVAFSYEAPHGPASNVTLWMTVMGDDGRRRLLSAWSPNVGVTFDRVPSRGRFICEIPRLPLRPGMYSIAISIYSDGTLADSFSHALSLEMLEGSFYPKGSLYRTGEFLHEFTWSVEST